MKRLTLFAVAALLVGCTPSQLATLRTDEQSAEQLYTATTQATADARVAAASLPANSAAAASAWHVISQAEKVEQTARLALDLARSALDAAQRKDAADPAFATAVTRVISAIPSPWTPILASLIPAAIPLLVSVVQSTKLGRAHQAILQVTEQLDQHKTALAALKESTQQQQPPQPAPAPGTTDPRS